MSQIFMSDSSLNRRFLIALILALTLLIVDRQTSYLKSTRLIISWALPFVEIPAYAPSRLSFWFEDSFQSRQALLKENARLRDQELNAQRYIQKFASMTAENIRLKELLGSSSILSESVLVSEIIGVDPDPLSHKIRLNNGISDGVFVGMPIIDARGLMGQVISVNEFSSQGLLITDSRHSLSVEVVRNGERAIAAGKGTFGEMSLMHIANTADIEVEDILVSSGLGGRFPKGYPVGIVKEVVRQPAKQYARVTIAPYAHLNRSRYVLLLFTDEADWESISHSETNEAPNKGEATGDD